MSTMLVISSQNQQGIFEKILRGKDGRLYAVRFVITEVAGQVRARVISSAPVCALSGNCSEARKTYCLSGDTKTTPEAFFGLETRDYISPFVSSLDFLVSQLTRAPSLNL